MIRIPDPIGFNGNLDVNPITGAFFTDAQKCHVGSEILNLASNEDQRFVTAAGMYGMLRSERDDDARCAIVIPELGLTLSTNN